MVGMEKVTLLAVIMCSALLERHILLQESVGAHVTALFWLSAGYAYCFVVLYIREDAALALLSALPKECSSSVF